MPYDWIRPAFSGALCLLLLVQSQALASPQTPPAAKPSLNINVLAGQNAANNLKAKTAAPLLIEVRDASNRPVPAAVLHLSTPFNAPGIVFANGSRSVTMVTEADGRVIVNGMTPEGPGVFNIVVEASASGEFATATITQANSENGAVRPGMAGSEALSQSGAGGKHLSKAVIFGIIAGVAVAAGAGLALGLRSKGHSSSSSSSTSGIGVGTPTVGAP